MNKVLILDTRQGGGEKEEEEKEGRSLSFLPPFSPPALLSSQPTKTMKGALIKGVSEREEIWSE